MCPRRLLHEQQWPLVPATRLDMLTVAARRYGEDWESARRWARRAYPQFFRTGAAWGKFKTDYQQELGVREYAIDDEEARIVVAAGDHRSLRSTGQPLMFDQTGVTDYASAWNAEPVPAAAERESVVPSACLAEPTVPLQGLNEPDGMYARRLLRLNLPYQALAFMDTHAAPDGWRYERQGCHAALAAQGGARP